MGQSDFHLMYLSSQDKPQHLLAAINPVFNKKHERSTII